MQLQIGAGVSLKGPNGMTANSYEEKMEFRETIGPPQRFWASDSLINFEFHYRESPKGHIALRMSRNEDFLFEFLVANSSGHWDSDKYVNIWKIDQNELEKKIIEAFIHRKLAMMISFSDVNDAVRMVSVYVSGLLSFRFRAATELQLV